MRSRGLDNNTASCHRVVMLISDGGTEFPLEQLQTIRNDTRTATTRVFTVAIGPHPIPTTAMKNVSCSYQGLHTAIMNYGAIPNKVRVGWQLLIILILSDYLESGEWLILLVSHYRTTFRCSTVHWRCLTTRL